MPLSVSNGLATIFIRKASFESANLIRAEIDEQFNLTDLEFRVEGGLIAIGPVPSDDLIGPMLEYFESKGLVYFEDLFELSGNWPEWLRLYAM